MDDDDDDDGDDDADDDDDEEEEEEEEAEEADDVVGLELMTAGARRGEAGVRRDEGDDADADAAGEWGKLSTGGVGDVDNDDDAEDGTREDGLLFIREFVWLF